MTEGQQTYRYFFEVAYHGKNYHGWQMQNNAISVQQVLSECLSTLLKQEITITGSGRTDTGVHCMQQFFHVDIIGKIPTDTFQYKLNAFLPPDISIQGIRPVIPEAHARFDAKFRAYQYQIVRSKSPFHQGLAYYYDKPLNIEAMNSVSKTLLGIHDFEAFSKIKTEVNNFECEIKEAYWEEEHNMLYFNVRANRFLRGMVRCMVGTLLEVGLGRRTAADVKEVLIKRDRRLAGRAVPAEGLYLMEVGYPSSLYL